MAVAVRGGWLADRIWTLEPGSGVSGDRKAAGPSIPDRGGHSRWMEGSRTDPTHSQCAY